VHPDLVELEPLEPLEPVEQRLLLVRRDQLLPVDEARRLV
jgi:hypothetical protein